MSNRAAAEWFERLGESMAGVAEDAGFRALGPPADRHGSWEIALHRPGDLDRFVSLTFTETPGLYDLELWAGAEDGARFVRRLVAQLGVRWEQLEDPALIERVRDLLGRAMELAGDLQVSDLAEAYL